MANANNYIEDVQRCDTNTSPPNTTIETVCQTIKADRHKKHVTFYHLLAKDAGKFAAF